MSEAQSKALSARFNTALEASLQAWQQKHHAVIPGVACRGTGGRISPGKSSRILPGE
nr:hypothetical protein J4V74_000450 [Escherichia coli]